MAVIPPRLKRLSLAFLFGLLFGASLLVAFRVLARPLPSETLVWKASSPPPIDTASNPSRVETATLACGCFWGPDSRFGALEGVIRTRVGYSGGKSANPSYDAMGDHTESVEIDFDPAKISFRQLMDVFAKVEGIHRVPIRRQYRNAIFFHDDQQRDTARQVLAKAGLVFVDVEPFQNFTRAEDYHQKYHLQLSPLMKDYLRVFPDFRHFTDSTAATRVNGYLMGHGEPEQRQRDLAGLGLSPQGQQSLLKAAAAPGFDCQ